MHKCDKKSLNNISQNNHEMNVNNDEKSIEKNLTEDNNFKLNLNLEKNGYLDMNNSENKDVENISSSENFNKDVKNTVNNLNEKMFNNNKKNFKKNNLFLENIFTYQATKSPEKSELNAENNNEKLNVRESYRGLKNKFKLEENNNMSNSKELEEKAYSGKLTDNNAVLRIMDNPFAVNPNYKTEYTNETDDRVKKEVKVSLNKSTRPELNSIFTPTKLNNNSTSNSKKESSKQQLKIGAQMKTSNNNNILNFIIQPSNAHLKGKDSKSLNERDNNYSNNILLTSTSNQSPNVIKNISNHNAVNLNNFNKNNKKGNPIQINAFKQYSDVNANRCNVINLNNNLNAFKNQHTINTENNQENFILQTNSNSVSPNNFFNSLSNQNKNNGNYSTSNSATSNVLISSNFQNHVCHTVENDNYINKDETMTVNYCNTNPNESDKIDLLKFNKNANFNFTRIKENEGDKFSLKNNSLNKILQNMKGNNMPYSINNQSTFNNINNINGTTNSNILSTNHTDINTLLNSNNNFSKNLNNKANKDLNPNVFNNNNKKNLVMSIDLNTEKPLKKSIDLSNKNKGNSNHINNNNILTSSVKDSQDLIKNVNYLNKNDIKNNNADTPRKNLNKNSNDLNHRNIKENKLISKRISYNNDEVNNRKNSNLDKSNKEVIKYLDTEEKKEKYEKMLFNTRDNPNRHSSNIEKSKLKKNSLSNYTYSNTNNAQNNKILGTKENRVSKDLDKNNNNIISSYNNKNTFKDKNFNLKNINYINNDNVLKNFNYVSIGYLDNPLVNSGALVSKDKSKNKNIDAKNIIKNEEEAKIENADQKNDLLNSNSTKNIQNKINQNFNNKLKNISVKEFKESTNASTKSNNIQNIAVTKSLNLINKKNQPMSSITKLKKDFTDKNYCVNMSNKIIMNNKNSINSKTSGGVAVPENKNANLFVKKDVCRIFNSDDFYERNRAKQLQLQEVTNTLNNIKLTSLYSKNLSQKINQSKNIQINLYNREDNELDPDKLYNLDFNSNLKNKEKTIIIDDIEELEDEIYKYSEKKPVSQLIREEKIPNEELNNRPRESLTSNANQANNNKITDNNTFKSDILHSILNFKGFFKNNEKNLLENIYQSQDCVMQLNKLNEKLEKLKISNSSNMDFEKANNKTKNTNLEADEDCFVKIKDSPLKPEISNLKLEKEKTQNNQQIKRINDLHNSDKKFETDREYYYFQKENSFVNTDKLNNKETKFDSYALKNHQTDLIKKENFSEKNEIKNSEEPNKKSREDYQAADNYLEKSEKTNIIKEIHFNSDVRMKRYEILLDFINTNMKEIGKMVSGEAENELKKSSESNNLNRNNYENEKNGILNNKLINQNNFNPKHKVNFSKNDVDFSDPKNIYYTSYVNSLKKVEETNSNKASSLHSKINLNSRLSNNEFNIDNSEIKESNNYLAEEGNKHSNLLESNFTNHFKEQINNLSLILNLQNKENNKNNNLDDRNHKNETNEFESINFYKNKKDPGSSLLISSIYSDFNQDLIDESFNNNILHLISNPNQQSKVYPNGYFTSSNPPNGDDNPNEIYVKKESIKFNKEINSFNINELNRNSEIKKLDSKKNLVNLNANYNNHQTQNQIINNIITMNNNYNRSKQQLAIVKDSKNNFNQLNEKSSIPVAKSKTELTNANLNLKIKINNDAKSKNNLDKNLLTLINNNNINKMLNQNIANPNILNNKVNNFPRSEITKTNTLIETNNFELREKNKEYFIQERLNQRQNTVELFNAEENFKAINLENKDSSEMIFEKETNINLIKNIENNFNNINTINNKTNKINQINEDQKSSSRASNINNNINTNLIKLDHKLNSALNQKTEDRKSIKVNPKNVRQQITPTNDSDRTVVQFYEKNVNLDNFQMSKNIDEKNLINFESSASIANNLKDNFNNQPNGLLMNTVEKNKMGILNQKNEVLKDSKTYIQMNDKILGDEINKDKPKCLIF